MPLLSESRVPPGKFRDPRFTAEGEQRATVALQSLETLWFNTGTLCNIKCENCYIESSPGNNRLLYLGAHEAAAYLDEIDALGLSTREIGFTGGEPFLNAELPRMLEDALSRGHEVLVLTNAMRPMTRPTVQRQLLRLRDLYGARLRLRISLDHHTRELHERERGSRSWDAATKGLAWLAGSGFSISVAGRTCWDEEEKTARDGYGALFAQLGVDLDAHDPGALVLFPEMDENADVPEITVDCWGILGVDPADMMCASSRMIVRRKGASRPTVLACTLQPYDPQFELGATLAEALGTVALNHPHCAKFCVLGGGQCSVRTDD